MAMPTTLETARLRLRPFRDDDLDAYAAILGRPGVLQYFPVTAPMTREQAAKSLARIQGHWREHGYGLWIVELRSTGQVMGRAGLQLIPETNEVEVDGILDEPWWNQGYATEMAAASLRNGFDHLAVQEIVGIVHPDNIGSRRVLEKTGLALSRRDNYFGMDCLRYAITRERFRELPAG